MFYRCPHCNREYIIEEEAQECVDGHMKKIRKVLADRRKRVREENKRLKKRQEEEAQRQVVYLQHAKELLVEHREGKHGSFSQTHVNQCVECSKFYAEERREGLKNLYMYGIDPRRIQAENDRLAKQLKDIDQIFFMLDEI